MTLKQTRRSLHLTQKEMAAKLGLSIWNYQRCEQNNTPLPGDAAAKLNALTPAKPAKPWTPERLNKLMKKQDWNQSDLAAVLGVSRQAVSMWINAPETYRPGIKATKRLENLA